MPELRDDYTTEIDPARAAVIPDIQRAAREEMEFGPLNTAYAKGIDDILSWLGGEASHDLINSARIRRATKKALADLR